MQNRKYPIDEYFISRKIDELRIKNPKATGGTLVELLKKLEESLEQNYNISEGARAEIQAAGRKAFQGKEYEIEEHMKQEIT